MRLSSIQKDILFILFAVEQKGKLDPIPGVTVMKMVNSSRSCEVFDSNFRVSCHKLNEHGLIERYRSARSLRLAWGLSEVGRQKAKEVYTHRLVN